MIILPDRKTMLTRLMKVSSSSHVVSEFYPLLLKHAGQKKTPEGVDMMLAFAEYDYMKDHPASTQTAFHLLIPLFRKALVK